MSAHSRTRRSWLGAAALLVFLFSGSAVAQQPWRWPSAPRVVVVADVHGAYDELVSLLETTGIVDRQLRWRGGDSRLVSLGDLLDRGAGSRRVMDLLMRLQDEAAAAGGGVHVVLGNHELMNLLGDLRYVSAAEYAAFEADEDEAVREAARVRFIARATELSPADAAVRFEEQYPRGYFAHRQAFGLDGRYGAWLLSLPALLVIGDTAFVHGGLPALVAETSGEINERVTGSLRRYLEIRARLSDRGVLPPLDPGGEPESVREASQALAANPSPQARESAGLLRELVSLGEEPALGLDGPAWYRGSVYCNPFLERPLLDEALRQVDAKRVVVGHTPTDDRRARALYDGRLIMLDTGMLTEYYSGRPAALLIEEGRVEVQYLSPPERLSLERDRIEANGLTESEVVAALARGAIRAIADERRAEIRSEPGEVRAVQVEHDGSSLAAVFYPNDTSRAGPRAGDLELAAYELDRLLGLDLVPPTVARRFDGVPGALQLRYADAVTEAERVDGSAAVAGWCPLEPQVQLLNVFDLLTFNTGRTRDNIMFLAERSVLKATGYSQAFGTERRLRLNGIELQVSPQVRDALRSLDARRLEQTIGSLLDTRQQRALLARREQLLEHSNPR